MYVHNTIFVEQSNPFLNMQYDFQEQVELYLNKSTEVLNYDDEDDKYLMEYRIFNTNEMQIFIKTIDDKLLTFEMELSNKIRDIKMKIQEKTNLSAHQQNLYFQGEILNDDERTINEYGIVEKSVIDIVAGLIGGMKIFAKTKEGIDVLIEVENSDKIVDVKAKIYDKIGMHADTQKLIYQGGILDDDNKTINEYQICELSVINVVARLRDVMQIFAKTMDEKTVLFEVFKSERIIDIKYKIQDKLGLHPDEQILIYQGGILDDYDKTIDKYQICEKSVIHVFKKLRNEIQIFIKISNKSIIPINIVYTSRIIDVKSIIKEETGIQLTGNINLIYENNILLDKKILIDYQIEDGSVISIDIDSQLLLFLEAIKSASLEKVQDLYDNKLNEIDKELSSASPMHHACKQRNTDIVNFLIKNNFKMNSFDNKLKKPIHYACINNSVKILELLIQHNCNLEVSDSHGMKPIHLACLHCNFQNVKILIENHCDLESQDYLGRRPIHLACLVGNIDIVKLLVQNKCKIDVLDKSNKSPFNIAEKENRVEIIKILNEEVSLKMIESMITELNLKCDNNCDHKFCSTSLHKKTFNIGVKVGRGGYGEVYRCKLSQSSHEIAIKQILISEIDSKTIEGNINRFIDQINHERIIKYFGAMTNYENVFIFMEFMSGGSLRSKIVPNSPIEFEKVVHYTIQILEGLQFLHSMKIIHRDIKPDNILLDDDGNVKLTDLGLGLLLSTTDGCTAQANTFCGTMFYMAPEIINGEGYSYGADIWSLGVTVIEMATGKRPYSHLQVPQAVMFKIATTKIIPYQLTGSSSNKLKQIIDQMLDQEPSKRPSATDLISNLKTKP